MLRENIKMRKTFDNHYEVCISRVQTKAFNHYPVKAPFCFRK